VTVKYGEEKLQINLRVEKEMILCIGLLNLEKKNSEKGALEGE